MKFVVNIISVFITPSRDPGFGAVFEWKKNKDKTETRYVATVFRFILL